MVGEVAAAHADGVHLRHVFGRSHQRRHRAERPARVIHVESRDDHPHAVVGQLSADIDDAFVEELCLVDADHIDIRGHQQDVLRRFDRRRTDGVGVVRDDLLLRVADVDAGLEDFYPLVGELCAFEAADQLFGFAREHRTADHFDPALAAGIFQKHVVCAVFSFRRVAKLPDDGPRLSRESPLSPLSGVSSAFGALDSVG